MPRSNLCDTLQEAAAVAAAGGGEEGRAWSCFVVVGLLFFSYVENLKTKKKK